MGFSELTNSKGSRRSDPDDRDLRDIVRDHCHFASGHRMGEQVGRLATEGYSGLLDVPFRGERYTERQVYDWCGLQNRKHWTKEEE